MRPVLALQDPLVLMRVISPNRIRGVNASILFRRWEGMP